MIACCRELLKVSFELTDRNGRMQDIGGDSPNIAGHVMIWLVLQTAGFKTIEDFFWEALVGVRFTQH
jgi:hypothetical protein